MRKKRTTLIITEKIEIKDFYHTNKTYTHDELARLSSATFKKIFQEALYVTS